MPPLYLPIDDWYQHSSILGAATQVVYKVKAEQYNQNSKNPHCKRKPFELKNVAIIFSNVSFLFFPSRDVIDIKIFNMISNHLLLQLINNYSCFLFLMFKCTLTFIFFFMTISPGCAIAFFSRSCRRRS